MRRKSLQRHKLTTSYKINRGYTLISKACKGYTLISKACKGYTLIELLVGITIISIVFTIGYASFREFSRRQALTGITKIIKGDLRLAQQLALTGEKPAVGACTTLQGYTFAPSSDSYTLVANCSPDGDRIVKTVNLEDEITLTGTSILFKVLGLGTNLSSDSVLNLSHSIAGGSVDITIGPGGEIK
ncbi:prepilin-type N-terminal cleavage/methylation domain-containing protein [Candidatus Microgenomates bacterium]|nr:prepilin-type N-terminal cleavage/methylation domain-containing protein [Candidatus Microgenomates bacterium]